MRFIVWWICKWYGMAKEVHESFVPIILTDDIDFFQAMFPYFIERFNNNVFLQMVGGSILMLNHTLYLMQHLFHPLTTFSLSFLERPSHRSVLLWSIHPLSESFSFGNAPSSSKRPLPQTRTSKNGACLLFAGYLEKRVIEHRHPKLSWVGTCHS